MGEHEVEPPMGPMQTPGSQESLAVASRENIRKDTEDGDGNSVAPALDTSASECQPATPDKSVEDACARTEVASSTQGTEDAVMEASASLGKRALADDDDATKNKSKKKKKSNESSVVYISRIPPGMDVGALRSRLSRMGTLGRVWLQKEDSEAVSARRQLGGRRSRGFSEGWVEFSRRRDAKNAVALLNGQPINAAKRGGRWGNDLWCLKLLARDYTWHHLYEETMGNARERVLRVKAAVAAGRRERAFIEERDALAKRISRKEHRAAEEAPEEEPQRRIVRRFRQRKAVPDSLHEDDPDERRAREAAERLEQGTEAPAAPVDKELVQMLFGKKKRS